MKIYKFLYGLLICIFLQNGLMQAQGFSWQTNYFSAPQYNANGFSFRYYAGTRTCVYNNEGNVASLLAQNGVVKADTLGLDSHTANGLIEKSPLLSTMQYGVLTTITNVNQEDRSTFGYLLYHGEISFTETYSTWSYQPIDNIYFTVTVPLFKYKFVNNGFTDLTPDTENGVFNKNNANWNNFLQQYPAILASYGLSTENYSQYSLGDIQCLATIENIYKKDLVCTIDGTVGIITPTGKRARRDHIFTVDYGYKKQWGVYVGTTLTSLFSHVFEWQIGARGIFFTEGSKIVRLQANEHQQSFFKLTQGIARHDIGNVWNIYTTCQFSIPGRSSLLAIVGYAFNGQGDSALYPEDGATFKSYIVNTDPALKKWYSHSVFTQISFVRELHNPRLRCGEQCAVSLYLDYPFAGKNVVKGKRYGTSCGLVVNFDF